VWCFFPTSRTCVLTLFTNGPSGTLLLFVEGFLLYIIYHTNPTKCCLVCLLQILYYCPADLACHISIACSSIAIIIIIIILLSWVTLYYQFVLVCLILLLIWLINCYWCSIFSMHDTFLFAHACQPFNVTHFPWTPPPPFICFGSRANWALPTLSLDRIYISLYKVDYFYSIN
jgi:hypothetical protein